MSSKKIYIIFSICFVILIALIMIQNNKLENLIKQESIEKTRQIQRLDAAIDFSTKKSKFLMVSRDIIKKHNRSITDDEAYSIAEFNLYVCEKYNLNPVLLLALQRQESNFSVKAKSDSGAMGLCQIMPFTGRWMCDVKNIQYFENMLYDYKVNIDFAATYLSYLKSEFNNLDHVLMSYNWGPHRVYRYRISKNKKMPEETRKYVIAIKKFYRRFNEELVGYLPVSVNHQVL